MLWRDAVIVVSKQTMTDSILHVALLGAVNRALRQDLQKGGYIQADETPVPCQSERAAQGKNHQAYFFEYSRLHSPVVFDFRMGRERAAQQVYLEDYKRPQQTDGYAGYPKLGAKPLILQAGCWAHARRYFH